MWGLGHPKRTQGPRGERASCSPQGTPCPSQPGWWVTVVPFVTCLCDTPWRCIWSTRPWHPPRNVWQDGYGTGRECGAGKEPLSTAHVFPRYTRQPHGAEAFLRSFPLAHPYPFPPSCRMTERPPSRPRVAWEENRAPQESSSPPEPHELCVPKPLQTSK